MSKVKSFILSGCVEVIAECTQQGAGIYQLVRPLRVNQVPLPTQTPKGWQINWAVSFTQFAPTAITPSFAITQEDIVCGPFEPSRQAEDEYIKITSGIVVAH